MNITTQNEGDGSNRQNNQTTGAGAGRMVAPVRGGRGTIGAGGGGGALVRRSDTLARDEFGRVVPGARLGKVSSTRGGVSVRSSERARLAADGSARWADSVAAGAMVGAGVVAVADGGRWSCAQIGALSLDHLPIAAALLSAYPAAGVLLGEAQGQILLAVCAAMSRKLLASMRRDGKQPSSTTGDDASAAGVLAVARWRAINSKFPARRVRGSVVGVAWRAIVRESSRDILGDAVPLGDGWQADSLAASAVPLPQLTGDDSREDKAARLVVERARARRPAVLAARVESIAAAGGRGSRAVAVSKVGQAAALMLGGMRIDDAATAAGFKARGAGRGAARAGDALAQAVRRLGFAFRFNLRESVKLGSLVTFERVTFGRFSVLCPVERGEFGGLADIRQTSERGGAFLASSIHPARVRSWSFAPSAGLAPQRGKLPGAVVKADIARVRRARVASERKGTVARLSARATVKAAQARREHRQAVRGAKLRGEFFGAFLPAVEHDGAAIRTARLLSEWRGKVWGAV